MVTVFGDNATIHHTSTVPHFSISLQSNIHTIRPIRRLLLIIILFLLHRLLLLLLSSTALTYS